MRTATLPTAPKEQCDYRRKKFLDKAGRFAGTCNFLLCAGRDQKRHGLRSLIGRAPDASKPVARPAHVFGAGSYCGWVSTYIANSAPRPSRMGDLEHAPSPVCLPSMPLSNRWVVGISALCELELSSK